MTLWNTTVDQAQGTTEKMVGLEFDTIKLKKSLIRKLKYRIFVKYNTK